MAFSIICNLEKKQNLNINATSTIIEISTLDDLKNIANDLSGNYILKNDITIPGGTTWTQIGNGLNPFMGIFDGDGNIITFGSENNPVKITNCSYGGGLFGSMGHDNINPNVIIKNLGIDGAIEVNLGSDGRFGVIVGDAMGGIISNCFNRAKIVASTADYFNDDDEAYCGVYGVGCARVVSNCYNLGNITIFANSSGTEEGDWGFSFTIDGIGGYSENNNCYNAGNLTMIGNYGGHKTKTNKNYGVNGIGSETVNNCYNIGEIICIDKARLGASQYANAIGSGTMANCAYFNSAKQTYNGSSITIDGQSYTAYGYKIPKATASTLPIYQNNGSTTTTDEDIKSFLIALWNTSNGNNQLTKNHFESDIWASTDSSGNDISWNFSNIWKIDEETGFNVFSAIALHNLSILFNQSNTTLILYVLELQQGSYVILNQFFLTSNINISISMNVGTKGKLLFSKCYYNQITNSSGGGTHTHNEYVFDTGSKGEEYTHEFTFSGGQSVNNFIVV